MTTKVTNPKPSTLTTKRKCTTILLEFLLNHA
jgi:hypothetical protein